MEPPSDRMRCIAATTEGRCPHFAKSKYFCDEHLEQCNKLHDKYKKTCNIAQEKGRVVYRDVDIMNVEELRKYIDLLNKNYALNRRCIEERSLFKEDCVQEDCEDEGHRYFYQQFPKARDEIEKLLSEANQRIIKLEREAQLPPKKGKIEKEFKTKPKIASRSPEARKRSKSSSRSPPAGIGDIEEEELERLKQVNQMEQEKIRQRKLDIVDQILAILVSIEHPNYDNLTYDMNVELNFNLLLSFQQNFQNSKLVKFEDQFFDDLLDHCKNNPPVISAQTILPFYEEFPLSTFEAFLHIMKQEPWWLCRMSILGSYAAMPAKVEYEKGTREILADKKKDQSAEKKKLAKRLALLLKFTKLDLRDRVKKIRSLVMKIDQGFDNIATRTKALHLSASDLSQVSKEELEKVKYIRGKTLMPSDLAFEAAEHFFYDYFNIPELEFLIEKFKAD